MQIHDLNTKALTDPAYVAFDDGTDTYKTEFNQCVEDAAAAAAAEALKTIDVSDNTVAFTSDDATSPTAWSDMSLLSSGLSLKNLFNRLSTAAKNIRWLYSQLGTTDISSIGNGTVKGAISTLNGNMGVAKFTCAVSDVLTEGASIGIFDKASGTTRIYGMARNTENNIESNVPLLTIPAAYRPAVGVSGIGMVKLNSGVVYFTNRINVTRDGSISQNFTSSLRECFFVVEYTL